jgi:hypothetical protein
MTAVATLAGAPAYRAVDWPSIDWKNVKRTVRRLQARSATRSSKTVAH